MYRIMLIGEEPQNIPPVLVRVTTGNELARILDGALGYEFDYDAALHEDEMELLSELVQTVQDYGDLWSDPGAGEKVRATYHMTQLLEQVEQTDYFVFGARENRVIEGVTRVPQIGP